VLLKIFPNVIGIRLLNLLLEVAEAIQRAEQIAFLIACKTYLKSVGFCMVMEYLPSWQLVSFADSVI